MRGGMGASGDVGMPLVGIRHSSTRPGIEGKRILVTRSGEQAGVLSEKLRALGAIPIEFPMIRVVPPIDWQPVDEAVRRLCAWEAHAVSYQTAQAARLPGAGQEQPYYAWLVFTSANGVRYFFERVHTLGYDSSAIRGTRVAAIGTATEASLGEHGISADLVPGEFVAEGLVAALVEDAEKRGESLAGKRVLLARAAEARSTLPMGLQEAGASVEDVAVYRTVPVSGDDETGRQVLRMLREGQVDVLTFTSSSTVRNFVQWVNDNLVDDREEEPGRPQGTPVQYTMPAHRDDSGRASLVGALMQRWNPDMAVACIGPVTARTARELGLQVQIEARESTIDGLIEGIVRYEEGR